MTVATPRVITRAEVEDFLYHEAALLDEWKLNEWQELLTDDAAYYVPPNDQLEGDHRTTLFLVADDRERIRQRIIRVLDPNCHAEFPKSRTRRLISNVRIVARERARERARPGARRGLLDAHLRREAVLRVRADDLLSDGAGRAPVASLFGGLEQAKESDFARL